MTQSPRLAAKDIRLTGFTVENIVRSSAYATDCPCASFYPLNERDLIHSTMADSDVWVNGEAASRLLQSATDDADGFLIIDDLLNKTGFSEFDCCMAGRKTPARFLAAVNVTDRQGVQQGILLVADFVPKAGLSDAKIYVLRSHAAQIAVLLEVETLQGVAAAANQTRKFEMERLRLLESVVINANDAILITQAEPIDLPGPRVVYCNAAFTRITGYAEAEMLGLTPRILQSANTDRKALDRLRAALLAWKPIEIELLNTRKDGTEFWVEMSIAPVADEKGWFTHWISVQRDVSDRKFFEEATTRARVVEAQNVRLAAEIDERKGVEARLLYTSNHDDLTKLHNRPFFVERLTSAINRKRADPAYRCAVMFIDLDKFKLVNDSLGHRAGDLLLMEIANRLRACIRVEDTLARVGGDEFALLVEGPDAMTAAIGLAQRMTKVMREPIWLGSQEIFSSFCIGIVEAAPRHLIPEELVRDADIAMYQAKRGEAGSYVVFAEEMHSAAVEALTTRTDLQNAVSCRQFYLEYQPIWEVDTLRLTGMEALVRWLHPLRGPVSPAGFIETAELTGLIRDIGRWVVSEACAQAREWQVRYPNSMLRLSINASAPELKDINFVSGLHKTLISTGFSPSCLQVEIPESMFIEDADLIDTILTGIRSMGVRVALDDFGTGFTSLHFLDRFPLDAIKIDQSFVAKMLSQPKTLAIVGTIVRLGQILDLDIIAEGVEETEQLIQLASIGCNSVQGHLLGKPMSVIDFEALLSCQ